VSAPSATAPEDRPNLLFLDPAGLFFGRYGLGYERALGRWFSVAVEGGYYRSSDSAGTLAQGGMVSLSPQLHLFRPAPGGLYLAPVGQLIGVSVQTHSGGSGVGFGVTAGATLGWCWAWPRVTFRLGLGMVYASLTAIARGEDGSSGEYSQIGWFPTGDLSFGVRF
jgi:hypothetical protein